MLSHQGRREFGAAVEPMTAEAIVLHMIDDLDAKLNQLRTAREQGVGLAYLKGLGRYVYLGGLTRQEDSSAPAAESSLANDPGAAERRGWDAIL